MNFGPEISHGEVKTQESTRVPLKARWIMERAMGWAIVVMVRREEEVEAKVLLFDEMPCTMEMA